MSKKKHTPLWSIHSESNPVSYLFGTMHVQDARAFSFAEAAKGCIEKCDEFYTEIHFDAMTDSRMFLAQKLPEGVTIMSLLGPKKFAKADKQIQKSFGIPLSYMNDILPMIVINQLVMKYLSEDNNQHLDMTLFQYAQSLEKTTKGIETIEGHISVLEKIPLALQKKQLLDFIKSPAKYKKKTASLANLYAKGDIYQLYKLSKKSMGEMKEIMIYKRNREMASYIDGNSQKSSFYAVGAGHLAGKKGIIRLLKNKSYRLKPILT